MKGLGQALNDDELDAMMEEAMEDRSLRWSQENRETLLPLIKLRQILQEQRAETIRDSTPLLEQHVFEKVPGEVFQRILVFLKRTRKAGDEQFITIEDFKLLIES